MTTLLHIDASPRGERFPSQVLRGSHSRRLTREFVEAWKKANPNNLAWTTFTWHLSAELNDGTPIETDGRQTDIWEKQNGEWLIVHEHISAPVSLELKRNRTSGIS